jgi:peptidoglycan/LPS O-acetylase OafA/YrhL
MGIIRTLLALAVVLSHAGSAYGFLKPYVAVELFYVASGFLISFVLQANDRYRTNWGIFYLNRALRLYPIYLVVFLVAACGYLIAPSVFGPPALLSAQLSLGTKIYLWASNIALFGQDWAYWLGLKDGNLVVMINYWLSKPPLWTFYPVPQSWTLGIEVSFYLLAPALLIRSRVLLIALTITGGLKLWALSKFGDGDPWIYRIFPIELSLFLLGAASQRWLHPFYLKLKKQSGVFALDCVLLILSIVVLIGVVPAFYLLDISYVSSFDGLVSCLLFSAVLPALFEWQSNSKVDGLIGELSYPIYISHWQVQSFVGFLFGASAAANKETSAWSIVGLTVTVSVFLIVVVSHPIEMLRRRIRLSISQR